ncbi:MAG: SWIM zinc finger family protein [Candidatus Brocadiaceae bacterium]
MYGWGWRPYISVAEKKRQADQAVAKMKKKGQKVSPVKVEGRSLANTFWGKAWCEHLESFSDYENRLPRGRSYLRNGSVVHLDLEKGKIEALVQGSSLYKVQIDISAVSQEKWQAISRKCSGEIASVVELLQGKLSSSVMSTITDKEQGLFPLPKEIKLNCSCPDWADMCKHVAAVLYGIGARLDHEPELLFKLRKVDHMELVNNVNLNTKSARPAKSAVIKDQDLSDLFGIDINESSTTSKIKKVHKTARTQKAPQLPVTSGVKKEKTVKAKKIGLKTSAKQRKASVEKVKMQSTKIETKEPTKTLKEKGVDKKAKKKA